MTDETITEHNRETTIARLEALLFVAAGPVSPLQLASALELPLHEIEKNLIILDQRLSSDIEPRGLRLQRNHGRVQITTSPGLAMDVEKFLGLETSNKLSRAALETLAIIAYQQPVTTTGN